MQSFNLEPFFPVAARLRRIASRWDELDTGVPFDSFAAYVRSRQPAPCSCKKERTAIMAPHKICSQAPGTNSHEEYRPAYVLLKNPASWNRYQKTCKLQQLALLEVALAYCIAATVMVPKSTHELLATAYDNCLLFDGKRVELTEIERKCRDDRVKGGKLRQERLNPAREYARRLYVKLRPPEGWKNTTAAIRTIQPRVRAFVQRYHLPVLAGNEQDTVRTIRTWLTRQTGSVSDAT